MAKIPKHKLLRRVCDMKIGDELWISPGSIVVDEKDTVWVHKYGVELERLDLANAKCKKVRIRRTEDGIIAYLLEINYYWVRLRLTTIEGNLTSFEDDQDVDDPDWLYLPVIAFTDEEPIDKKEALAKALAEEDYHLAAQIRDAFKN